MCRASTAARSPPITHDSLGSLLSQHLIRAERSEPNTSDRRRRLSRRPPQFRHRPTLPSSSSLHPRQHRRYIGLAAYGRLARGLSRRLTVTAGTLDHLSPVQDPSPEPEPQSRFIQLAQNVSDSLSQRADPAPRPELV
ncbi:hypothetical protein K466DRAFT_592229 [Polyporus arcularius HHB13444]|uniref:Uncharacterized protein n=1 Tax=Polyporus arcularius HHB13444 TaxID=1314778 RepID=A0A5C3NQC6_9APHY|nr:hypothetical protein K466DRAFT_592229 [Polyporus arcularius HHB13444]